MIIACLAFETFETFETTAHIYYIDRPQRCGAATASSSVQQRYELWDAMDDGATHAPQDDDDGDDCSPNLCLQFQWSLMCSAAVRIRLLHWLMCRSCCYSSFSSFHIDIFVLRYHFYSARFFRFLHHLMFLSCFEPFLYLYKHLIPTDARAAINAQYLCLLCSAWKKCGVL